MRVIPFLGGTKKIDPIKLRELQPNLIIVDKEENTREIADSCDDLAHVTHITSISDVGPTLSVMAEILKSNKLHEIALRWERISQTGMPVRPVSQLPGVLEWLIPANDSSKRLVYCIWKEPYMTVSKDTFIGSVLSHLGYGDLIPSYPSKYPEITFDDFNPEDTTLLFSSEPYPFEREREEIKRLRFPAALVNGEAFSWYGVRTLRLLEEALN